MDRSHSDFCIIQLLIFIVQRHIIILKVSYRFCSTSDVDCSAHRRGSSAPHWKFHFSRWTDVASHWVPSNLLITYVHLVGSFMHIAPEFEQFDDASAPLLPI